MSTVKERRVLARASESGGRSTAIAAMIVDAWNELRVNRLRILLALVGIAVAVVGLTGALGLGTIMRDMMIQTGERQSGRTATVTVTLPSGDEQAKRDRLERLPNDFGVTSWTHVAQYNSRAWTPVAQIDFSINAVDPSYETLYRVHLQQGRFLVADDAQRLAPAVVVDHALWMQLGSPDIATNPGMTLVAGDRSQQAVIVGVSSAMSEWDTPTAFMLYSGMDKVVKNETSDSGGKIAMWVPEDIADQFAQQLNHQLGKSLDVTASREDWAKFGADQLASLQTGVIAAAVGMFLLGALGLVNINLVTMQHRVREIGIRRSYGATSGRIFFGVLLESVVATFVAGLVGVMIAIALLQNSFVETWLESMGVYDHSAFPIEAALIGLAASTIVGALAGALPALKATRVQIIEAIRF